MVPTTLQRMANKLLTADLVPNAEGTATESNDLKDRLKPLVSPWL